MKNHNEFKDDVLSIYVEDLSIQTLKAIRNDLGRYTHLKAYSRLYSDLVRIITARKRHELVRD